MNYKIVLDRTFEKEVKRLAKRYPSLKSDIKALRDEILANPTAGTDLGGGLPPCPWHTTTWAYSACRKETGTRRRYTSPWLRQQG